MYIHPKNKEEDENEIFNFIQAHPFATLVGTVNNQPWAVHIPLLLSDDRKMLIGHIAKANPIWKNFETQTSALVIFMGAHAYVSSSWYDHENVSTWNYQAVHVYGRIQLQSEESFRKALANLTTHFEKGMKHPRLMENMSDKFIQQEMRAAIGFQLSIDKIEASYKLSQNRDDKNHHNIVTELENLPDENANAIAKAMRSQRK